MKQLKLGILGMSKGNGHPYSWASIINGYDPAYMKECPFPSIPQYLERKKYPDDFISDAKVTHIWTQDEDISAHIAKASKIPFVVNSFEDMIGSIDAVLLARDDAENHYNYARSFLETGIPIYIDKPFALFLNDAEHLFSLQKYPSQIFTCTALRFAHEFVLREEDRQHIGRPLVIDAVTPNSWEKYSVHIIEPVLQIIGDHGTITNSNLSVKNGITRLQLEFATGLFVCFTSLGRNACPIQIHIWGDKGETLREFQDPFYAFKTALQSFLQSVRFGREIIPREETLDVIKIIELGIEQE